MIVHKLTSDVGQGYSGPKTGNGGQGIEPWTHKKIVLQGQGFKPWTYQKYIVYDHANDHTYARAYDHKN